MAKKKARLTEDQKNAIKAAPSGTLSELAKQFGTSVATVARYRHDEPKRAPEAAKAQVKRPAKAGRDETSFSRIDAVRQVLKRTDISADARLSMVEAFVS